MGNLHSTCRWNGSAKLPDPEAAAGVERLDGEDTAAAVAEDQVPGHAGAARARELRPPAAQERAVAVPPDLDAPGRSLAAGRAEDDGLLGADSLGNLVGDALQKQARRDGISSATSMAK